MKSKTTKLKYNLDLDELADESYLSCSQQSNVLMLLGLWSSPKGRTPVTLLQGTAPC